MKSKPIVSVYNSLVGRSSICNRGIARATRQSSATFAVAVAALLVSQMARATTYYWDANGAATTAVAPTGTWGTSAFWSTDPTGASATSNLTITNADDVFFSAAANGTAGTVTVQTTKVASSISFDDNVAVTLNGGTSITLGGTGTNKGVFAVSGANANSTINTPLILSTECTVQNAGLGTINLSGGITGTVNLILRNNAGNNTGFNISGGSTNIVGTITNSGTGAGGVISIGIGTNVTGVIQNSATSFLRLSGNNLYTSGTTITAGSLSFITTLAKPATGMTTVAAGATLGLGVSGTNPFSSTDVDNLFADNLVGNLANVTMDSTSRVGIDTTAGDFTYASNITSSRTLHKLGVNALTLTGNNNSASGETIVAVAGTLRVGDSTHFTGGTLSLVGLPNATAPILDLRNDLSTDFAKDLQIAGPANAPHTINVDRAIGGSGTGNVHTIGAISQPIAAARTLTVSGANGYGLTINELSLCPGTGQGTTLAANVNVTVNDVTNPMSGFGPTNFDTLTLSGSSTASTVIGVIEDAVGGNITAGGTTRLSKAGAGTWTIGDANTYSGRTTIVQGTLNVASLNSVNGGTPLLASSTLGAPTTAIDGTIQMGATTTTGVLNYTGAGETTDRGINLAGTTGGATITQSGTNLLKFTGTNTATGAGIKTLTLNGSTAGSGEIAGGIANNSTANRTSVTKNGTGTWALSGANTYTGSTNANGGILQLDMSGGTGFLSDSTALTLGGGTFGIKGSAGGSAQTVASLAVNGGAGKIAIDPNGGTTTLTITSPTLTRAASGVINFDTSAGTPATAQIAWSPIVTDGIIGAAYTMTDNTGTGLATITGGLVTRLGSETVLTATNPTSAGIDFVTNTPGTITNSVTPAADLNSLSIDTAAGASTWNLGAGNTATVTSGALLMFGANNFTIRNGILRSNTLTNSNLAINQSGAGILTIDSEIADGNGASTVSKFGAGTLVLGGANTYTGGTTLSSGTLVLSGSSSTSGIAINGGTDTTLLVTAAAATGSGAIAIQNGVTNANVRFHIDGGGTITLPNALSGNSGITTNFDVDNNGDASTNGIIQLTGSMAVSATGNATYNITGGNGYSLMIDNLRNTGGGAGTLLLNPTTADVSIGNATVNPAVTTTTGTYVLGLGGTSTNNTVTGVISNNADGPAIHSVTKSNTGTWTLSGANTYTGATNVNGGILKAGSASTFTTKGALAMAGSGILDLNGFDVSFTNVSASTTTNTITNNGAADATFNVTTTLNSNGTISSLIQDGVKKLTVSFINNNSGSVLFRPDSPNTFSGGVKLLHNTVNGTRLRITGLITTVGTPGAIVSSPFGTGPITIGTVAGDRAAILFDTVENNTLVNDIIVNSAAGTDVVGGLRVDRPGNILSGKITANLANVMFTGTAGGGVSLTGQVTGDYGVQLNNVPVSVTLNNAADTNNYLGDTIVGSNAILNLGRPEQIPNGAATGKVEVHGTWNLNGFDESINGLTGTGVIEAADGTPTLTLGDNDATGETFSGSINDTAGALSLTKIGSGTQTLSGTNTYTGETKVLAGTLAIAGNSIADTGKLTIDGGKVDIAAATNETVNTLFFGAAQQPAGTYGSMSSSATFKDDSRFSGDGIVTVLTGAAGADYASWLALFPSLVGADQLAAADPDRDDLTNRQEYAFALNPTTGSSVSPIIVQLNKTAGTFTYSRRKPSLTGLTYRILKSADLVTWTLDATATQTPTDAGDNQTVVVTLTGAPLTATKLFVRVAAE